MPSVICRDCNGKISTPPYKRKAELAKMVEVHLKTCPARNRGKDA